MAKKSPKILIIDDDMDFIDAISTLIKSAAYDVVFVTSPKQVKEKIFQEKPDLILLDVMMDSLFDGFSLCNTIKSSSAYKEFNDVPIIMVSAVKELTGARFDIRKEEEGFKGPDTFFDKPVNPTELLAAIKKLLQK